jgi:hypothetical protein
MMPPGGQAPISLRAPVAPPSAGSTNPLTQLVDMLFGADAFTLQWWEAELLAFLGAHK